MSDVKRFEERLECMLFRVRFAEELEELKPVKFKTIIQYAYNVAHFKNYLKI